MRRFRDDDGAEWTVALWCGSYGEVLLIFSVAGRAEVFSVPLEAESLAVGEAMLLELDDAELVRRLGDADPWEY